MKFAVAIHGTRGDVEPGAAVGFELLRRGHDVRMAVPPNLVGFVESVGLAAVAYGPDSQKQLDADFYRDSSSLVALLTGSSLRESPRNWAIQNPIRLVRAGKEYLSQGWAEMSTTLRSLADGVDLILTGQTYQGVAANVAEYCDVPFAALHYFPHRVNGHIVSFLPSPLVRSGMRVLDWIYWQITKEADNAQRRELGLAKAKASVARRIMDRGSLEIQAYDDLYFPGLAAEWGGRRPFVGTLTLELPTDADDEAASWIAAGTPPIYFGFGSLPIESPADTVAMVSETCAQLGERALICSGVSDLTRIPHFEHVKIVGAVNHAAIFPACRAVVHHGSPGTLTVGIRAGIPTLILWSNGESPIWAAQVKRLKVGSARRFSTTTRESLVADLRSILAPHYVARAREIATRMTKPAASVTAAADLLENTARR